MKNILVILIFIIFENGTISQDLLRPFRQITFENYSPLWYHTFQDSTFIKPEIRRSHLNAFDPSDQFTTYEIVKNNKLYFNLMIRREIDFEGSYFGCIDVNNGKKEWHKYFNLDTQDKQEFTQSMIVDDNTVELIGFKTTSEYGSNLLPLELFDTTCYMTRRIHDRFSGEEIITNFSNPDGENTQRLSWGGIRKIFKYSQIFKIGDNNYKHIHHSKVNPDNTVDISDINENGIITSPTKSIALEKRLHSFDYFQMDAENYVLVEDDFLRENNRYTIHFKDKEFNKLHSVKTKDTIPIDSYIREFNAQEKYFVFISTTYSPLDTFRFFPERILRVIDFEGNTLKKVLLQDHRGFSMDRYGYLYDKAKNELIVCFSYFRGIYYSPKSRVQFYFSDDSSTSLKLKSDLAVEDSLKIVFVKRMTKTEDGNLIVLWEEVDLNEKEGAYDQPDRASKAVSFVCFDPKTLGLTSSTFEEQIKVNVNIYPNPSTGNFVLSIDQPYTNIYLNVYDISGNSVLQMYPIIDENSEIDISHLRQGIYTYQLVDKNKILKTGKIVKIE